MVGNMVGDSDENKDTAKDVTDVLLISTELKDNYKVEADAQVSSR